MTQPVHGKVLYVHAHHGDSRPINNIALRRLVDLTRHLCTMVQGPSLSNLKVATVEICGCQPAKCANYRASVLAVSICQSSLDGEVRLRENEAFASAVTVV